MTISVELRRQIATLKAITSAIAGHPMTSPSVVLDAVMQEIEQMPPEYLPNLLQIVRLFRESVTFKSAEAKGEAAAVNHDYKTGEPVALDNGYATQLAQHQSSEQVIFRQALASAGLVGPVQTPKMTTSNSFQPIPVQGEAVSQTLLDERR